MFLSKMVKLNKKASDEESDAIFYGQMIDGYAVLVISAAESSPICAHERGNHDGGCLAYGCDNAGQSFPLIEKADFCAGEYALLRSLAADSRQGMVDLRVPEQGESDGKKSF